MGECRIHGTRFLGSSCPRCEEGGSGNLLTDALARGGIVEIDPSSDPTPDQALIEALQDIATAFNRVADAIERYGEEKCKRERNQ